jgi:uncharacterized protein YqcC (DUF446 family)
LWFCQRRIAGGDWRLGIRRADESLMSLANLAKIADVILLVEAELRKQGLWDEAMPSASAMQSSLPFSCDTLTFQQWLQWIFIPRVAYYIERDLAFPFAAQITPYAEEVLKNVTFNANELIRLLEEFDRLVEEPKTYHN